jgi:hypothetical protein
MRGHRSTHPHESPDNKDSHLYSTRTTENVCRHERAVLGERIWEVPPPASANSRTSSIGPRL